ncbi:MAG: hypothetical protein ACOYUZ_02405 [Patescibacteria group bacterium]
MNIRPFLWISAIILLFAVFLQFFRIPFSQGDMWMSPDETANVQSAIRLADTGSVLEIKEYLRDFPWAHPRSYVYLPESGAMAPVAFLGMVIILAVIYKIFGFLGILFYAPLLVMVTAYAFWKILPPKWPPIVKYLTLIIWLTFPLVLLYANRGSFPQISIACIAIWIWWALAIKLNWIKILFAGLIFGLAAAIRPLELIWLLPLVVFTLLHYKTNAGEGLLQKFTRRRILVYAALFIAAASIFIFAGAYIGKQTYGTWLTSGYQIRHTGVAESAAGGEDRFGTELHSKNISIWSALPFSFHPKNILWNFENYLIKYFWLYTLVLFAVIFFLLKEKAWRGKNRWALLALTWTAFILIVFYGNGLYQDHVRINQVSLGNSFLRYILPIGILYALGAGYIINRLWTSWSTKIISICLAIVLIAFGQWTAFIRDNEGILSVESELGRYHEIRNETVKFFDEPTLIFSDRSDKIFYPLYDVVSPLPDTQKIIEISDLFIYNALYLPTQDEMGERQWREKGIILFPVFTNGNQTMYEFVSAKVMQEFEDSYNAGDIELPEFIDEEGNWDEDPSLWEEVDLE